jgi:hypothetical protein
MVPAMASVLDRRFEDATRRQKTRVIPECFGCRLLRGSPVCSRRDVGGCRHERNIEARHVSDADPFGMRTFGAG